MTPATNVPQELVREVAALLGAWEDGNAIADAIADALPEFKTVDETWNDALYTYLYPKQDESFMLHIVTKYNMSNFDHASYFLDVYEYAPDDRIVLSREDVFLGSGPAEETLASELIANVLRVFSSGV